MNLKLMQLTSTMVGRLNFIPVFCLVTLAASVLAAATPWHLNRLGAHDEKVGVEALGENITLRCSTDLDISGNKFGHSTWMLLERNGTGRIIAAQDCKSGPCIRNSSDDRFHVDLNRTEGTANLFISEVHPSDLGNYVCVIASLDGVEESKKALVIIPPVDITCTCCEIDGSDNVIVEVDTEVDIRCFTGDEFNARISLNADGLSGIKRKTSIRLTPTLQDDGKQIKCIVESEVKNQRNITLHVMEGNKPTSNTPTTSTSTENGRMTSTSTTRAKTAATSKQPVCFYAGVFDDEGNFLQFAKCYQPKKEGGDVLVLANNLPNALGIVSCTGDVCTDPIKVKIEDEEEREQDKNPFTATTYLCISLYVVIGMTFLVIIIVTVWRKRKDGVSVQVNYHHDYTEPCSAPLHHPRPPASPVSEWSTTSARTNYPASQYYPSSIIAEDDELQGFSTTWEDDVSSGGKRHSLVRSLSARARKSFRDSTVVYGNVPFVTIMDRVKTVGLSYF